MGSEELPRHNGWAAAGSTVRSTHIRTAADSKEADSRAAAEGSRPASEADSKAAPEAGSTRAADSIEAGSIASRSRIRSHNHHKDHSTMTSSSNSSLWR
jgi:hypothetical protein